VIRAWIGIALLSGSWMLGTGYYQAANQTASTILVLLGILFLSGTIGRLPQHRQLAVSLALLLPAIVVLPWPEKTVPLTIGFGLALALVPIPRSWPRPIAKGAIVAGVVMLTQAVVLSIYKTQTARNHDMPYSLSYLISRIVSLMGLDAAANGATIAIRELGQTHQLAATWDLLLDPVTLCFYLGAAVWIGLVARSQLRSGLRWSWWLRSFRILSVIIVAWLPVRMGLMIGLFLHRTLRADPSIPPSEMGQVLSPWLCMLLLIGPVFLLSIFIRRPPSGTSGYGESVSESNGLTAGQLSAFLAIIVMAVAIFAAAIQWSPVGKRLSGRVMVVERHSTWEPTTKSYSTDSYGELASYNYGALYDYCSRYFQMSQLLESDNIDEQTLGKCDVLIIKVPTSRFSRKEVDAINDFVRSGGGLLLIGDHTNVFNSSTYLNGIARTFGFTFRNDLLFRIGRPYDQEYQPPWPPHPAIQNVPPMYFAVSCSIDPGTSRGEAVIQNVGLWSLPPEYSTENYHPEAEYRPEMRYGAFIQLWATRYGAGRVIAFTDSTIFSNFCTFQPGKAELWLNMIEWLNHRSTFNNHWLQMAVVTSIVVFVLLLLVFGIRLVAGTGQTVWLFALAATILGWTCGSALITKVHGRSMPEPQAIRPMNRVIIDQTVSKVPLALGAFNQGDGEGFGLLEQWVPRLGYFTARRSGAAAFSGNALIILYPTGSVTRQYRESLVEFVENGGKLLVVDSPDNAGSTSNSLVWPFGMSIDHSASEQGQLILTDGWPKLPIRSACKVVGGKPIAKVNGKAVGAATEYGKGKVMALGFGTFFNDKNMGAHWMRTPDVKTLTRYNTLFAIIQSLIENKPIATSLQTFSADKK